MLIIKFLQWFDKSKNLFDLPNTSEMLRSKFLDNDNAKMFVLKNSI